MRRTSSAFITTPHAFTVASLIVMMAQISTLDMRPRVRFSRVRGADSEVAQLFGWLGAVSGLSSILGPLIGGAIVREAV